MSAVTATAVSKAHNKKRFPPPTTKFGHPRWFTNKVVELAESIPASHIMLWAWVAVYYLLFQVLHGQHALGVTMPDVKGYWDTLFSRHIRLLSQHNWDTWRHFLRDGGEAYLVTMTVLFLTFNPYSRKKPIDKLDSVWEVMGRVLLALVAAIPIMVGVSLLFHGIQDWFHTGTLAPALGAHPNLVQKMYTSSWPTKVSVVIAGLICRRLMYPVFTFVQEYFAERRVAKGKRDHWWQPAAFRARVRELHARNEVVGFNIATGRIKARSNAVVYLMSGGLLLVLILGAYGFYIENWVA